MSRRIGSQTSEVGQLDSVSIDAQQVRLIVSFSTRRGMLGIMKTAHADKKAKAQTRRSGEGEAAAAINVEEAGRQPDEGEVSNH